ncbi:hypothetical protein U8335_14765 [Roseiconus lacunae]|uniref:hypothetical protein n=1 Tax=Roseiconus lacunae TaxID=2605694 RepID=UPI00308B1B30|nr:hypothetical protein U8335_14765 [Stieleria sp. HD01]
MNRIAKTFAAVASLALGMIVSTPARAGHESLVYDSADHYRDAVKDFERLVLRTDGVERCDERLVDDLEDSTSHLRSASRDLRRIDRLFEKFAKTESLHRQVESVFFHQGRYPYCPRLEASWRLVSFHFAGVVRELNALQLGRPIGTCNIGSRGGVSVHVSNPSISVRSLAKPPVTPPHIGSIHQNRGPNAAGNWNDLGDWNSRHRGNVAHPHDHHRPSGRAGTHPAYGIGADLQRRHDPRKSPTIERSAKDELRRAIVGAILQRM